MTTITDLPKINPFLNVSCLLMLLATASSFKAPASPVCENGIIIQADYLNSNDQGRVPQVSELFLCDDYVTWTQQTSEEPFEITMTVQSRSGHWDAATSQGTMEYRLQLEEFEALLTLTGVGEDHKLTIRLDNGETTVIEISQISYQ